MPQGPTGKKKDKIERGRERGGEGEKVGRGERERERVLNTISPLGSNFHRWRGHHCLTVCCHVNLVWQDKAVISARRGCKLPAIQGHARVDLHCISLYTIAVTKPPEFLHVNLSLSLSTSLPVRQHRICGKLCKLHILRMPMDPKAPLPQEKMFRTLIIHWSHFHIGLYFSICRVKLTERAIKPMFHVLRFAFLGMIVFKAFLARFCLKIIPKKADVNIITGINLVIKP